jgi:hypothetical protein
MATRGKRDIDEQLILALAAGGGVVDAARVAQVSERTVRRRMQDPAFRERVRSMRAELVTRAVGRLSVLGCKAADGLNDLMGSSREQTKLGACRATLEYLFRGSELVEIEQRLQALEDAQKATEARR